MTNYGTIRRIRACFVILAVCLTSGLFLLPTRAEGAARGVPGGGRIEGIVVSAETGVPLRGATVWLDQMVEAETDPVPRRRAVTDEAGRFLFDRVRPGRHVIYAEKRGFLRTRYPVAPSGVRAPTLMVEPGSSISDIRLGLRLGAKISGRAWNEQGAPAIGLIVKLLVLRPSDEGGSAASVVSIRTDEGGRFQFDGLYPGQYVLRAERRAQGETGARLEFAYYPDADSWPSATPFEVGPGDVITGVDVTFYPNAQPSAITGRVVDALTGEPLPGVRVSVVDGTNLGLHTKTTETGRYRLEGVPPGTYMLSAHGELVGDGYQRVSKKLGLPPGDTEMDLELLPAPLIAGTIEYVGSGRPPSAGDFMISVRADRSHRGINYSGGETFEFRGLKAGPVRLGVGFASLQYRLAAILVDEEDVTSRVLDLHPGERLTSVRILITDDQGFERTEFQIAK